MKKVIAIVTASLIMVVALAACAQTPTTITTAPAIRTISAKGMEKYISFRMWLTFM